MCYVSKEEAEADAEDDLSTAMELITCFIGTERALMNCRQANKAFLPCCLSALGRVRKKEREMERDQVTMNNRTNT